MKHHALPLSVLLITAALLAAAAFARAAGDPPELLSYQGYLVDANGAPLGVDGSGNPLPSNYDVTFSIFDASSGGELLWREQQTITVDAGYFSVLLGEGTQVGSDPRPPLSEVFTGIGADERFIGVAARFEAGGEFSDILPRLRLLTSPYAFLATQARSVVNPDGDTLISAEGSDVTISGSLTTTQPLSAPSITGNGANLTNINASSISSGTLHSDRLPSTIGGTRTFSGNISANNRIGIGTTSPAAPLDVRGGVNASSTHAYLSPGTTQVQTSMSISGFTGTVNATTTMPVGIGTRTATLPYSIRAENAVGASQFTAYSDKRIKSSVETSETSHDLAKIQRLRVTEYFPTDWIGEGMIRRKGFIAQEVKEVIPEAVSKSTRFVPDIYQRPASMEHVSAKGILKLTMAQPHGVSPGDRVRIIVEGGERECEVVKVTGPDTFSVGGWHEMPNQVFVFGREVTDFLTLNYDHLFVTGIGAMQEMYREIERLKAENQNLARRLDRIESVESELVELREVVRQLLKERSALERASMQRGPKDESIGKSAGRNSRNL